MKILHFLWGLANGGAENLAVDLANEQAREHDVILLVANTRVDNFVRARIAPAVRFVCIGRPEGSRNPYWLWRLLVEVHTIRADIVHSHEGRLSTLGKLITAPIVLTVHTTGVELPPKTTTFSVVCCISESVFSDVKLRYPLLNVRQVNNGVMTSKIAKRNHNWSPSVRGVQVSRLVHATKGQDLLIRALAQVNKDRMQPILTIDFIGDGPSLEYLATMAVELGVTEYCNFLGAMSRDDVYRNLCNYDILVQPSRIEGFGLTVAEGMAAGVAVVVSDVEGPMEIIGGGKFGHFFKTNDVASLAVALRNVMATISTPEGKAMLSAARAHVAEKYDLIHTSRHYCRIYEEIIND